MNIKKIYRNLSDQFLLDFEKSAEINHNGNKGDYREATLREFLEVGRLPKRFAIGKGEIISSVQGVSKQSDLIIYDNMEGLSFEGKNDLKVFPIESVCGVIEVKSCLSKEKLIEGLENIKSVKKLAKNGSVTEHRGGFTITTPRPKPFAIIFAYKLSGNSLESLKKNLDEWEKENLPEHYPNLIVVLNEGIIKNQREIFTDCIFNEDLPKSKSTISLSFRKDSLFRFYAILIDLCSRSKAGSFDLMNYFDPSFLVDDLIVKGHNRFIGKLKTNKSETYNCKLTDTFIKKVYKWCQSVGKISHESYYNQCMGMLPTGISRQHLEYQVYLYNPDNLPQNDNKYEIIECGGAQKCDTGTLAPAHFIHINDEVYYIPGNYMTDDVYEVETNPNAISAD